MRSTIFLVGLSPMKNGYLKNSITYLFLAIFLSTKLASFHVINHAEDKEHALHCTICDHIVTTNSTPVVVADVAEFTFENKEFYFPIQPKNHYSFEISGEIASDQLFSRPPPVAL